MSIAREQDKDRPYDLHLFSANNTDDDLCLEVEVLYKDVIPTLYLFVNSTYYSNINEQKSYGVNSTGKYFSDRICVQIKNQDKPFKTSEKILCQIGLETKAGLKYYSFYINGTNITECFGNYLDIPTLTFMGSSNSSSPSYPLKIKVKSKSTITSIKVMVNGTVASNRSVNVVNNDGADFELKQLVTLKEGVNKIHVQVQDNADGTAFLEKSVTYTNVSKRTDIAQGQKCIALVIGNAEYQYGNKLVNPANDAKDVSAKLRALGFTVMEQENTSLGVMDRAINDFVRQSSKYDVAVFYYAGHAIENGVNYLIPVDARLEYRADLRTQCIDAQSVLDKLDEVGSKAKIIVLDACRDNPITRGWTRAIGGGLAQMVAPEGTYIMYSTGPGRTADDGAGRNSPFTNAFLTYLDVPNLSLNDFFINVAKLVRKNTDNMQAPWQSSSFYSDFYFNRQ